MLVLYLMQPLLGQINCIYFILVLSLPAIDNNLAFLSLNGGYTGSSWSKHVKMPHFWKSCHGSIYFIDDVTVLDAGTYLHVDHSPVLCT